MNFKLINPNNEEIFPFPFESAKDYILGENYDLNLIFTTKEEMRDLNLKHRDIDRATDILSFPLDENLGEIYICQEEAEKEAPKFDKDMKTFIPFLFIHGLVHLKGYDHGSKMESIEVDARKRFGVK